MNKDLIYQAIENPEALSRLNTADLERLTREHPWFSTAQVLLAKKYREGNDYRFTDQLQTAAMTSFNRRVLYTFLKKETPLAIAPTTEVLPVQAEVEATVSAEELIDLPIEAEQSAAVETTAPVANDLDDILEQQEGFFELFNSPAPSVSGSDTSLSELANAMMDEEPRVVESPAPVATIEALPTLPAIEEIKAEEPETTDTLEVEEEKETPAARVQIVPMDDLDRDILVTALNKSIELEVGERDQIENENKIESEFEEESEHEGMDPYTLWLMKRAGQLGYAGMAKVESAEQEEETEEEEEKEDFSPKEEKQGLSHGMQRLSGPSKLTQQKDLIDRFIRMEPKITPGKALDYSGTILGRESLEDHGGLVTETMAKLYVAQGKIDKAKKAYKRLIELFPEKSIYFATQLKNLNTKK